ncbi:uncharacterized protein N7515_006691 [Penicillium bovifimosum]|uniref:Uncharacterized protein n=1 Tax=Penicillium bovifimosum TaxID=126998 RepID=A0A9W9L1H2_9EURO|nr:uncharacterized protein N7515_006691 [Penicillium bovifimosum]KAJ5130652.1 hypothetical protein N7515_006691 [Penicillium bovifimosum]
MEWAVVRAVNEYSASLSLTPVKANLPSGSLMFACKITTQRCSEHGAFLVIVRARKSYHDLIVASMSELSSPDSYIYRGLSCERANTLAIEQFMFFRFRWGFSNQGAQWLSHLDPLQISVEHLDSFRTTPRTANTGVEEGNVKSGHLLVDPFGKVLDAGEAVHLKLPNMNEVASVGNFLRLKDAGSQRH